ncbi:NYN domain-containing protein [Devosia sp. LjRoot16]|uniref:NYN domain-containing protein n=1 Tax=Devosia sp. LjRoot16 TaxID=3342271 RepID=UPI003ECFF4D5
MASEAEVLQFAVLIDGENVSPKVADQLFRAIAKLGQAPVRRVYGDFDGSAKGWKDAVSRYAIIPRQQFPNVPNKNASDIALVIEAMDLLHTGRFDGFCLVSSDSDYTGLATRLREQGLKVFGFGGKVAAASFRLACHQFTELEGKAVTEGSIFVSPRKPIAIVASPAKPDSAKNLLLSAFARLNGDEWVPLSLLLKEVRAIQPQFTPKDYGSAKPIALVRKAGCFDAELQGGTMMVRKKPAAATMAARAA